MTKRRRKELAAAKSAEVNAPKPDESPVIPQDSKLKTPLEIDCRYRLTEKQQTILEVSTDKRAKVVMIDGYWGTGKSALAVLAALELMNQKKLSGIVYLRNPLEASATAKVGTLPGSLEERMETYNSIVYDKLREFLSKPDIDRLKHEGRIECLPVGLIQGKTFACKAVILDEAGGTSWDDLMLVISRMGEHSKLFIIGDSAFQLTIGAKSGFRRFFETFCDQESMDNGVFTFELKEQSDIMRSGLVRFVMQKTGVIKGPAQTAAEAREEPMFPPV
jgi:phosphate starvation-inducible PhoH-like protein